MNRSPATRVGAQGAIVVGSPGDDDAHAAVAVRSQKVRPDRRPDLALAGRSRERRLLGDRSVKRPVAVEVVREDEPGADRRGGVGDASGERLELGDPLLVGHVHAVVDHCGAGDRLSESGRVRHVGGHGLDAGSAGRAPAARHGPHSAAAAGELAHDGAARPAAGTEHDLESRDRDICR